jgi:hypothetical protein
MILRIWLNRTDPQQLEVIIDSIQDMHKSMKNVIDIVFAVSPLLALSTNGWYTKNVHSTYLLRVSGTLGILLSLNIDQPDLPCPR